MPWWRDAGDRGKTEGFGTGSSPTLGTLSIWKPGDPAAELPILNRQLPRASLAELSNKGRGSKEGREENGLPVIITSVQSLGITVED